jgi:hypothetical protein
MAASIASQLDRTHEWRLGAEFSRNTKNLRIVAGHNDPIEGAASQRRFDGPGDERLAADAADILTWHSL